MEKRNQGFTLIEMLVVLGIIAVLVAASIGGYTGMTKSAEKTRCQELVANVATALNVLYQKEGAWPKRIATQGASDGQLDAETAYPLKDYMSLNASNGKLIGLDRFGIVTPWATAVLKRRGNGGDASTFVSNSKKGAMTVQDHILHFAIDEDGDGIIEGASIGGSKVDVRATAIVWCGGKDGFVEPYNESRKSDDVYSFTRGQTQSVK